MALDLNSKTMNRMLDTQSAGWKSSQVWTEKFGDVLDKALNDGKHAALQ